MDSIIPGAPRDAQRAAEKVMHAQYVQAVTTDQGGEEWLFAKAAAKAKHGGLRASKSMLLGQVTARLDETTAAQMNGLLAAAVPHSEAQAMEQNLQRLNEVIPKSGTPKAAVMQEKVGLAELRSGARAERNAEWHPHGRTEDTQWCCGAAAMGICVELRADESLRN